MEASCAVRRCEDVVEVLVLRMILDEELLGSICHLEQFGHLCGILYILACESVLDVDTVAACFFENPHLFVGVVALRHGLDDVHLVVGSHAVIASSGVENAVYLPSFGFNILSPCKGAA